MKEKYKKLGFIFLVLIILLFLFLNNNFISIAKGHYKHREIVYEMLELGQEIKALEIEISRLVFDDSYIEKVVRENYAMIKEGEEVFKFTYATK